MNIQDLKDLIADLPAYAKVLVILAGLGTILGFAYISTPDEVAPEPTVNKEVKVGDVSGGVQGGFNITQ